MIADISSNVPVEQMNVHYLLLLICLKESVEMLFFFHHGVIYLFIYAQ